MLTKPTIRTCTHTWLHRRVWWKELVCLQLCLLLLSHMCIVVQVALLRSRFHPAAVRVRAGQAMHLSGSSHYTLDLCVVHVQKVVFNLYEALGVAFMYEKCHRIEFNLIWKASGIAEYSHGRINIIIIITHLHISAVKADIPAALSIILYFL